MLGALDGHVAVVTGAAGHLGSAMTAAMARSGARVVVADIDLARARQHARALGDNGHVALAVQLDVASPDSVGAAFAAITAQFGRVDVLVNNAAPSELVRCDTVALDLDLDVWQAIQDVIVRGALLCARAAIPAMAEQGRGSIVNIASVHAHAGDPNLTAYSVAKAGLLGLTRTLATQYGRAGIRCNSVTLGTIPFASWSDAAVRNKLRHQLVPRAGLPEDVAATVVFLASPLSGFTTGSDYSVDGGVLAHLPAYADGGSVEIVRQAPADVDD